MEILKEYNGYQLIKRYKKPYLRFWGGRDENMICEFPLTTEEEERALQNPSAIKELLIKAKTQIPWTVESFYRIGVMEFLLHRAKLSEKRAEYSYQKLACHPDIRKEFYFYVMNNDIFPKNLITIESFTAKRLITEYPFAPSGAYLYLVYLREKPEEALDNLKYHLPRK